MRRALGFTLALLLVLNAPAFAYQMTLPNTFTNGQVIDANLVMQDFNSITSTINGGIDHANVNGAVGFYASDLLPATAPAATFGGSLTYKFANGLIVNPGAANVVGLTMNLAASPTADLVQYKNSAGTVLSGVNAAGSVYSNGLLDTALVNAPCVKTDGSGTFQSTSCGSTYTGSAPIAVSGSTISCAGCVTSVGSSAPIASTGGTTPTISCPTCITTAGGQTISGTLTTGVFASSANGGVATYHIPIYTRDSLAVDSRIHGVYYPDDQITFNGVCSGGTFCTMSGATISFINTGAPFVNNTKFFCTASIVSGGSILGTVIPMCRVSSSNVATVDFFNPSGTVSSGSTVDVSILVVGI